MAWFWLTLAGLLEIGWAIGLKYVDGLARPLPLIGVGVALVGSMALLWLALRDLPIGTAYAVWVGIGAAGTAALGILLFDEPRDLPRLFFLGLLITAIIGLKLTARGA